MNEEVYRPTRCRGLSPRWRAALLLAGCGFGVAAAPAAAQSAEPPGWWLAESPGAGGARFGLGIDFRFEDLDSLLNTSASTTATLRDPATGKSFTQVIPGDPALNNRKFDYAFEQRSWGAQAPVALPRFSLGRGVTVFPSLVVEAATTEVTFDFHDRTKPEDSTSITGRGASYGLGLEAVATLGQKSRWFLGAGYRYRGLPALDLERSPPFGPSGNQGPGTFEVTRDRVRLSQDTHLASLRLGRALARGRVAPYLGVRGRWTDLEIDDELGFRSSLADETTLRTHTCFESDSALAVAGLDARLGERLVGRAEVTFGDGDVAVLAKVVYLFMHPQPSPPPPRTPPCVAVAIAAEFQRIEREFSQAAEELDPLRTSDPGSYRVRALELLDRTEKDAVEVLERCDYIALADWLRDRISEALIALRRGVTDASTGRLDDRRGAMAVRLARRGPAAATPEGGTGDGDGWVRSVVRALHLIFVRADEGCLSVKVQFAVEPSRQGLHVIVYPKSAPERAKRRQPNEVVELKIGSYTYYIEGRDESGSAAGGSPCGSENLDSPCILFQCLATNRPPGPDADCPLDLAEDPVTGVQCRLGDRSCEPGPHDQRCSDIGG